MNGFRNLGCTLLQISSMCGNQVLPDVILGCRSKRDLRLFHIDGLGLVVVSKLHGNTS